MKKRKQMKKRKKKQETGTLPTSGAKFAPVCEGAQAQEFKHRCEQ